jgi:hypothetical protein
MNFNKKLFSLVASGLVLASCLGPQTYFSEVFNTIYDTYYPTKNNANQPNLNYQVNATITTENGINTFEIYFFEVGMKLINTAPEIKEGVSTTRNLTLIFDYAEGGIFATRSYANNPAEIEKNFTEFEDDSFDLIDNAIGIFNSTLNAETIAIINNQATNLVIGGQPQTQDVKVYTLPVAQFVSLASFESTAGFIPTSLTVKVTHTTSTNAALFEISATGNGKSYSAVITLSNPDQVLASNHLLSPTEKATYSGYQSN